jgi:hypothetical protein
MRSQEFIEAEVFCIDMQGFSEFDIEILKNIMEMR